MQNMMQFQLFTLTLKCTNFVIFRGTWTSVETIASSHNAVFSLFWSSSLVTQTQQEIVARNAFTSIFGERLWGVDVNAVATVFCSTRSTAYTGTARAISDIFHRWTSQSIQIHLHVYITPIIKEPGSVSSDVRSYRLISNSQITSKQLEIQRPSSRSSVQLQRSANADRWPTS